MISAAWLMVGLYSGMRSMSPQAKLSALERRIAAIHEAGHVVVTQHLGGDIGCTSVARIMRNEPLKTGQRTWWGETKLPDIYRILNDLQLRMVGCAGAAAVYCWIDAVYCWIGEDVDPDLWTSPRFMDSMSLDDWILAGCKSGKPDRLCVKAINRLGPLVCTENLIRVDDVMESLKLAE